MPKILIVEDDEKLRNELEIFLSHQGYIDLTKNEYKILKYLIENRNKIVSREDIMVD